MLRLPDFARVMISNASFTSMFSRRHRVALAGYA